MAQCVVCSKIDPSYSPLSSTCPNCGFNAFAVDGPFTKFVAKIDAVGTSKLMTDPVATAILRLTPEGLSMTRVRPLLKLFLTLFNCADWVANLVHVVPMGKRTARLQNIDNELRGLIGRQEVLGFLNYSSLCADRANVAKICKQGWDVVKTKWAELADDKDRRALIAVTFEHDKGYPQSVQSAMNFTKSGEADVVFVLIAYLNSDSGVNPYTGIGGTNKQSPGDWISKGWVTANAKQREMMWMLLTSALEEKLRIGDCNKFVLLLQTHKQDIVDTLASYVPREAADAYVTTDARTAYDSVF